MKRFKTTTIVFSLITAICAVLHLLFFINKDFADWFNETIAYFFRFIFAKLTSFIPFSVAEILLFSIPLLAIALVVYLNAKGGSVKNRIVIAAKFFLTAAAGVYFLFVFTFAAGYQCSSLDIRLDIEKNDITKDDLYDTLVYVIEKTNEYAEKVEFKEDGASVLPVDYNGLSKEICASYDEVFAKYRIGNNFNSTVKPLIISPLMTYTHISGVYSFFTGEANLNTNYPDYVCAFSVAHELAHQRGVARENEANFLAYLVCIESDNDYLKYSGYLSMYSYLSSALRNTDYELWKDAASNLCDKANQELIAYFDFFNKYRDSAMSDVSDIFNDTYLKLQGTEGIKSYGMVVDLAVAYHKKN